MDVLEYEQKLYDLLLNHLDKKYNYSDYKELLEYENNSLLNYVLSHAYYEKGDTKEADKYRETAVRLNSNFDFEPDYNNIYRYIYCLFCTITAGENPFLDDEIDGMVKPDSTVSDFIDISEKYREVNDISNAVRITTLGINRYPDDESLKYDMASSLLYTGNFAKAWEYNDMRLDFVCGKLKQYIDKPKFSLQKDYASVYIYPVTQLGDSLFFARYLFRLKRDYPKLKLFVNVNEALKQLMEDNGINVYGKPDRSMIDYQIPLEGLPVLYKDCGVIVLPEGYLKANKDKSNDFRQKYFNNSKVKAGVVWRTSLDNDKRNIPLDLLCKLFETEGVQFYSLQKNMNLREELTTSRYGVLNMGIKTEDFSDTAAIIDNLDVVIGCDTSVTNLAGAMGKKTLIMLPYHADWRWGLFEQQSKWYNSAELFRQKENQDYSEVVSRIKERLYLLQ